MSSENQVPLLADAKDTLGLQWTGNNTPSTLATMSMLDTVNRLGIGLRSQQIPHLTDDVEIAFAPDGNLGYVIEGELHMIGINSKGQLGLDDRVLRNIPETVPANINKLGPVATLAMTSGTTLVVNADGHLFMAGVPIGVRVTKATPMHVRFVKLPLPDDVRITRVRCGEKHALALSSNGDVYAWGAGPEHGHDHDQHESMPRRVESLSDAVDIACGLRHSVVLTKQGHVYTWGLNQQGCLGLMGVVLGPEAMYGHPRQIPMSLLPKEPVVRVYAGGKHNMMLTESGRVWAFGNNSHGRCGFPSSWIMDPNHCLMPRLVDSLSPHRIVDIALGRRHSVFLSDQGIALACGDNKHGQASLPWLRSFTKPESVLISKFGLVHRVFSSPAADATGWLHGYVKGQTKAEFDAHAAALRKTEEEKPELSEQPRRHRARSRTRSRTRSRSRRSASSRNAQHVHAYSDPDPDLDRDAMPVAVSASPPAYDAAVAAVPTLVRVSPPLPVHSAATLAQLDSLPSAPSMDPDTVQDADHDQGDGNSDASVQRSRVKTTRERELAS